MKRNFKKPYVSSWFISLLLFAVISSLPAQEGKDTPLYPATNTNIIFIEGESAVATNFTVEPTLNFNASGSRTLQLNRSQGLQGGSAFFAEYVFYVEKDGTYRFGYGGTPPGPEQDLFPSYTSPVAITIDDGSPYGLYREQVRVAGQYLPTYYWIDAGWVELSAGVHTIRFHVTEKRRFDNKYLFYLDAFFFLHESALSDPGTPLPAVFPDSLMRETDIQFNTIADYEGVIAGATGETGPYLNLSNVYSLVGDYINALKTLRQIRLLHPDNADYLILAAKNRLWKGDIREGLRLYQQALGLAPDRIDTWNEAGKLAAWTGNHQESINFYTAGLENHPDNLGLTVNIGITHLWKSEEVQAEAYFSKAAEIAQGDIEAIIELGELYRINGYSDRAEKVYEEGIKSFPLTLEFYLNLIEIYTAQGLTGQAEEVFGRIQETFPPSDRLSTYLDTFQTKTSLREQAIAKYEQDVTDSPDNLELRDLLVQTYFWNGKRQEAIREYLHILTNHAYRTLLQFDTDSADMLRTIDFAYIYLEFYRRLAGTSTEKMREISGLIREYTTAVKKYQTLKEKENASEEERDEAGKAAAEAQKNASDAMAEQQQVYDKALGLVYSYQEIVKDIDSYIKSEEEETERYGAIIDQTGWSWDRNFFINELGKTILTEPQLSGHILGTIYRLEGRYGPAELVFRQSLTMGTPQPATAAGLLETYLWQGDWNNVDTVSIEYGNQITEYADYFGDLINFFTELREQEEIFTFIGSAEELNRQYQDLIASFEEAGTLAAEMVTTIQDDIIAVREILYAGMVRKFYTLETNTYLLRFELGKYYIAEERYVEATDQLNKVLDIDPWNIDAQFRLGVVRQHYGDWKDAMQKYRTVYNQDPYYPNAAAYYNLLARQHPDTFSINTQLLGDTSRISFAGDFSFSTAVTTLLSWEGSYSFDGIRLYKTYGEEEPSSHQIHYAGIGFPIHLYFINLTLTPGAGLYFSSDLFRENALSTSEAVLPMDHFLTLWDVVPSLNGKITFALPNFILTGTYRWKPVEETFVPERIRLREHEVSLNTYASLSGLEVPFFQYSSARIYGDLRLVEDSNMVGSAVEEFNFGIHLFDVPWTTLVVNETLSFEHSVTPSWISDNGYYAPDSVLVFKGGLLGSSWISLLNQNVLGVTLSAFAGGYWEKLISGPGPPALQLDFNGRLELAKSSSSYYLSLHGSQTFVPATDEILYWSLSVNLGVTARPAKLLAP